VDADGAPLPDGEVGELWVVSNGLMSGYYGQPEATAACFTDGWFRTGDLAVRHAATASAPASYSILGRASVDLIKSGGFRISAREIEEVLASVEGVAEVAVVGVPDPVWGERIVAWIAPKPEAPARTREGWLAVLTAHATGRLAPYKHPRAVEVVEALPRNAMGKMQKTRLRAPPGRGS
jgi:acyl-CoA synthetase (AMP-forming)/AMP-acid ligase II